MAYKILAKEIYGKIEMVVKVKGERWFPRRIKDINNVLRRKKKRINFTKLYVRRMKNIAVERIEIIERDVEPIIIYMTGLSLPRDVHVFERLLEEEVGHEIDPKTVVVDTEEWIGEGCEWEPYILYKDDRGIKILWNNETWKIPPRKIYDLRPYTDKRGWKDLEEVIRFE